jgi:hypothetical protein
MRQEKEPSERPAMQTWEFDEKEKWERENEKKYMVEKGRGGGKAYSVRCRSYCRGGLRSTSGK